MRSRGQTSEPWRVGVLFSRTGFMAVIEETQLRGTLLAMEEINAAGGVTVASSYLGLQSDVNGG